MNQKATYELTITEKLEQLTAPDMVDAIWARIEAQLDIDLPTDDGPTNPPAPASGPRTWLNRGFMIAAVAIVLIYFFNNRKQTITSNEQPTITAPVTTPNNNDNPVRNNSPGTNSVNTPQNNSSAPTNSSTELPVDSNSAAPVTGPLPLQPDSNTVQTNAPPVITPPLVSPQKNNVPDSTKKGRGVKGITDSDYKIVPKKDSSKN